jgi:hypothetical protein
VDVELIPHLMPEDSDTAEQIGDPTKFQDFGCRRLTVRQNSH